MIGQSDRHKIWLRRALLLAATSYGAYKICNSQQARHMMRVAKCLITAGWKISEALSVAAELSSKALVDVKEFLEAEEDEMPSSLVQLCKVLSSKEVGQATSSIVSAVVDGVGRAGLEEDSGLHNMGVVDRLLVRVIDGLLSEKGKTLVSLAISVATRNAVRSMCNSFMHPETMVRGGGVLVAPHNDCGGDRVIRSFATDVLNAVSSNKGERLLEVGISSFARNFVGACQESFSGAHIADGIFSAMAKPGNIEAIKGIAGAASREAMSSLVTTSSACFMEGAGVHSPTSVYVNNFEVEGCSSTFLEEPNSTVYGLDNQHRNLDSLTAQKSRSHKSKALPGCTKEMRVLDPLTNALMDFCQIPEARQLVASVAGSVAKESTKGILMSVPELALSFWNTASSAGIQCFRSSSFVSEENSAWMVILLCTLMYLSSNILTS